MMYPLVTDLAQAKGAQVRVPVAVSCAHPSRFRTGPSDGHTGRLTSP